MCFSASLSASRSTHVAPIYRPSESFPSLASDGKQLVDLLPTALRIVFAFEHSLHPIMLAVRRLRTFLVVFVLFVVDVKTPLLKR